MQLCKKCNINKKNSEFYKDAKRKDKLTSHCKFCMAAHKIQYRATKHGFLTQALQSAKIRSRNKKLEFDLDYDYLVSIATENCPVFKVPLLYVGTTKGSGNAEKNTASLDRVIPELGYIKENVVFISHWANTIKNNATEKELYLVADWLHDKRKEVLNAKPNTASPIPKRTNIKGAVGAELGSISTPWTWEDDNDTHHHCGADAREDTNHRAQEGSGDSVGAGDQEVGTSELLKNLENFGIAISAAASPEPIRGHLLSELRKRGVVNGTASDEPVQQPSD